MDLFQRYGVKRILNIPPFTPNYIVAKETDLKYLHFYTLRMRMNYVLKTMFNFGPTRLPNMLSNILNRKRIFWVDTWCSLWPLEEGINWVNCCRIEKTGRRRKSMHHMFLSGLEESIKRTNIRRALNSSHGLYKLLQHKEIYYLRNKSLSSSQIS